MPRTAETPDLSEEGSEVSSEAAPAEPEALVYVIGKFSTFVCSWRVFSSEENTLDLRPGSILSSCSGNTLEGVRDYWTAKFQARPDKVQLVMNAIHRLPDRALERIYEFEFEVPASATMMLTGLDM